MQTLWQDLRYAARMLAKSPGFAAVAVLTLAIGIGANTAIFSVIDGVLYRPLPYKDPNHLMMLSESSAQFAQGSIAYLNFRDWEKAQQSFSSMAIFRQDDYNLSGRGEPERVKVRLVSADFFSTLGITPLLGRGLLAQDDQPGAAPTVVLNHSFWQQKFAGDPQIIGKSIALNNTSYTVVGVLPANFWFYTPKDVFVTIGRSTQLCETNRVNRCGGYAVARLKPGVTQAQASADMKRIAAQLAKEYPDANAERSVNLTAILDDVVGDVRGTLYLLLGAVGFVLLIACANVANLLLARSTAREREIAVRSAMGASMSRVTRQFLTESILLAFLGGAIGILLAYLGTDSLLAAVPGSLPRTQGIGMNTGVLAFTLAVCVLTGIIFGLAPALKAAKVDIQKTLKEGGRGSVGGHHLLQQSLVVVELLLATVLLTGAGLTLRTIWRLNRVNPGFNPQNTITFSIALSPVSYSTPAKIRNFYRELPARLAHLPGVEAASIDSLVPLGGDSEVFFYIAGQPKPKPEDLPWSMFYIVSSGYQRAMDLRLSRGRFLTDQDTSTTPPVVVIDEIFARTMFPGHDPIGQHIIIPFPGFDQPREIVGIVNHVKQWGLAQDEHAKIQNQFYIPYDQIPDPLITQANSMSFVVRTAADPHTVIPSIQHAVHELDATQPIYGLQTMDEMIETSKSAQRFASLLLGIFGAIAVVLAALGIYGVMSYSVSQRTHEVGIRLALGAKPGNVLKMVLSQGSKLVVLGVVLGAAAAAGLTRLLSSLLYGVSATDPITFASVAVLLIAVALLGCYVPARRATRVDPLVALRYE